MVGFAAVAHLEVARFAYFRIVCAASALVSFPNRFFPFLFVVVEKRVCHATDGPPKMGPPGPSVANYVAMDGPPGPSTAAIDGPPGPSVAP